MHLKHVLDAGARPPKNGGFLPTFSNELDAQND